MNENVVLKKSVSQSLVEEVQASINHYDYEMRKACDEQVDLTERKRILELTVERISSEMPKNIILKMIEELQLELGQQKEREQYCRNNKKYYQEISEGLDETLNSI